jgi:hypothetical protein
LKVDRGVLGVTLPPYVADRVGEGLAALYRQPERALLPWYRYTIYAALAEGDPALGLAARAWLDIAAARKALFCWPPYARRGWPPHWSQPTGLLTLAEQLLAGSARVADAGTLLDRAYALADVAGEPADSPDYCSWCVFEAALRALGSAWRYATASAPSGIADSADDASTYAALAIGSGAWRPLAGSRRTGVRAGHWNWQTEDARLRRAVFWEWWLREAVAHAWRLANECVPVL